MKVIRALLGSRKFVVTVLGLGGAIAARLGLPEEHGVEVARLIVGGAAAYVGATAYEDAAAKRSAPAAPSGTSFTLRDGRLEAQ